MSGWFGIVRELNHTRHIRHTRVVETGRSSTFWKVFKGKLWQKSPSDLKSFLPVNLTTLYFDIDLLFIEPVADGPHEENDG